MIRFLPCSIPCWCSRVLTAALVISLCGTGMAQDAPGESVPAGIWHVGVAAIDITPEQPIRLNGFGGRRAESTEVRQRIWAKALAIGTDKQRPVVLITVDVLGIPDAMVTELAERLASQTAVSRERLAVTATHTHSGPMLQGENETLFGAPISGEHRQHIADYTRVFRAKLEQVTLDALADRSPARLSWGVGSCRFAINRRTAGGPVDHDLPLLAVRSLGGELRAIYVSYACHCVTLSDNQISGDWAGYAQAAIQRDYPGTVALCSVGCGADLNPNSGVTGDRADIAASQGEEVAAEVRRLLGGFLAPVNGPLKTQLERVSLALQPHPSRAEWEQRAQQENAVGHHARTQLARLDRGEALIEHIDAPVQSWQFGDSLAMVFLPGETVVDYSLRLKRELDAPRLWINGYSNAAPGYVPSERILTEGGYEGGGAMIYYDIPTPYAAGLEQQIVDAVHGQLGDSFAAKVDAARTNGVSPLSPQQSAARLRTRAEMRSELVVAEPLITDPVAIDFRPDGSMWVAEMHDYPEGVSGNFAAGGRVRLVRDSDGDGRYDNSTVFLDGIPFPTGVTTWRDGVLVCAAPDILYAEDTDGDGRADLKRVLFSGFGTDNYQARVNSLAYGLDGWVYGSCGLFGGEITSFAGGDAFPLGDRDFRLQPDSGRIEPATGRTQQGRVRDDWDNWFGCNNGTLLIHYPLADHFLRRNPYLSAPPAQVGLAPSNKLYPVIPPLTFKLSGPPGLTTAACGLGIYRDELLGAAFTGNSFTCEPVSQVVHRLQLVPTQATFTAQRADNESDREFLGSTDAWFRPVQARTGPDGALWVVDMCRYIIEHPRWIPPEDAALVDMRAGQDLGRIYRVFPRESPPRGITRLDQLDTEGLVQALDSPNGPQRDLAGQMLMWRGDQSAASLLIQTAERAERPEARLHALSVLSALEAVSVPRLATTLHDTHPGVRRQAVRIAGEMLGDSPELLPLLLELVGDADPFVRLQLASGLGESQDSRAAKALVQLARDNSDNRFITAAVMSSITPHNVATMLSAAFADRNGPALSVLIAQLLNVAAATDNQPALSRAVQIVTEESDDGLPAWQTAGLASLLAMLSKRDVPLIESVGPEAANRIETTVSNLRDVATDPDSGESQRLAALSVLGYESADAATDLTTLQDLLSPQQSIPVQLASVDALSRIDSADSLDVLLDAWFGATPQIRGAIFDAAAGRAAWLPHLLAELDGGRISPVDIDASRAARLLEHADEAVRQRAAQVFGASASADRQAVLDQYRAATELEGDAGHGQTLFNKSCAVCHRLHGVGHVVGPDLAPLVNKTPEYLLLAILDPSAAVDSRYLNYVVALQDGRTFSGILAEESGGGMTLAMQEGRRQAILRRDIEALRSTGKSLMPEGVEKDLSVQDVADIIAFLRTPQAPSATPEREFAGNHPQLVEPTATGRLLLLATNGSIHGDTIVFEEPFRNVGYWHGEADHVDWTVRIPEDGTFEVWMLYACDDASAGNRFVLEGGSEPLQGVVPGTGGWSRYVRLQIGRLNLKAGERTITMRPNGPLSRPALVDLYGLELVPVGQESELALPTVEAEPPPDPRDIARQLLDESLPSEQRQALIALHQNSAAELIAMLSEDLSGGPEEYRRIPWIWRVSIAAGRRNQDAEIRAVMAVSLPGLGRVLHDWQAVVIGGGIINGISQQDVWPGARLAELLQADGGLAARWNQVLTSAAKMADDERIPTGTRYDALRILGCGGWQTHGRQLSRYLAADTNAELQMGAVSGLVDLDAAESTEALVLSLPHLSDGNRSLAIDGLLRTSERTDALLDAIENGSLSAQAVNDKQTAALRTHSTPRIKERSRQLLPD